MLVKKIHFFDVKENTTSELIDVLFSLAWTCMSSLEVSNAVKYKLKYYNEIKNFKTSKNSIVSSLH